MAKIVNLFTPIEATISPISGTILFPEDMVTIDTNVPADILWTLDGSDPREGYATTFKGEAPIEIALSVSTIIKFKATDNRAGFSFNQTKTQKASYTVDRLNPIELFRTNRFFVGLNRVIVDHNFYIGDPSAGFLAPVSADPMTLVFVNREPFTVRVRVKHNGIDIFTDVFPVVVTNGSLEIPLLPFSGDNQISIETQNVLEGALSDTALYDIGLYDIDTYAP